MNLNISKVVNYAQSGEYGDSSSLVLELAQEILHLRKWVSDLQSGLYVNCVYCGMRYGRVEDTPISMADVLKSHVEICKSHPLAAALEKIRQLEASGKTKDIIDFRELLNTQIELQQKLEWPCGKGPASAQMNLFAAQIEISEVANEINWKTWKRTPKVVDVSKVATELTDVFQFLANVAIAFNISPNELSEALRAKWITNFGTDYAERWK